MLARLLRWLLLLAALPVAAAAAPGADLERPVSGDQLFARLTTERKEPYLQEIFEVTLAVYSRGLTMGRETSVLDLEASGLNVFPLQDLGSDREELNGKVFAVHRFLGRAQAVAAGTFSLQPAVHVEVVVPGPGGSSQGQPGRAELRQIELRPPPLTLVVRTLPEAGRPEGFTGAVGSFTFSAAVHPTRATAGDPVALTMEIQGRGNIEALAAPAFPADDRFKAYEPKLLAREFGEDRTRGRVVFEQTLIPTSPASTPLPAVSFSYFDPVEGSYRAISAGPFALTVTPAASPGPVVVAGPAPGPGARDPALGAKLAGLKSEPGEWPDGPARPWHASLGFVVLQVLPLGVLAALFFAVRRREERARDVAGTRRRLAPQAARAGINAAEQALRRGDPAGFHDALWEALSAYFGNRFNLLPGEISREAVIERLARAGLDPQGVARFSRIFDLLEQERFGRRPAAAASLPDQERQRLAGLLEELGRALNESDRVGQ